MPKKQIEIRVFGSEGILGTVSAQLDDKALDEIARVVNKHLKTDALNVKGAGDKTFDIQPGVHHEFDPKTEKIEFVSGNE